MSNNEQELSFEEVWKSFEEQDTTGAYKQAREMADLAREQLEYAYNSGYKIAKAKYIRPQGRWILIHPLQENDEGAYMCSVCHSGDWFTSPEFEFCPHCGAAMDGGNAE